MAEPSKTRNFFGRLVDKVLPGSNYNVNTGQFSNIGKGSIGLGARIAATMFAGPLAGQLVGKGASYLIDHTGNQVGVAPQPQAQPSYGPSPGYTNAVTMPAISNLGFGAQTPGNSWAGYMQGQGSANNFGNQQFGSGMASQPGSWGPQSQWGQQVTAQPVTQGSNLGFGNNVQQFSGGSEGGGSASYSRGGSGMPGTMGGRLAKDSMITVARRWANK